MLGSGLCKTFPFFAEEVSKHQVVLVCPTFSARHSGTSLNAKEHCPVWASVYGFRYNCYGSVSCFYAVQRVYLDGVERLLVAWGSGSGLEQIGKWKNCHVSDEQEVLESKFGFSRFEDILADSLVIRTDAQIFRKFGPGGETVYYHAMPYCFNGLPLRGSRGLFTKNLTAQFNICLRAELPTLSAEFDVEQARRDLDLEKPRLIEDDWCFAIPGGICADPVKFGPPTKRDIHEFDHRDEEEINEHPRPAHVESAAVTEQNSDDEESVNDSAEKSDETPSPPAPGKKQKKGKPTKVMDLKSTSAAFSAVPVNSLRPPQDFAFGQPFVFGGIPPGASIPTQGFSVPMGGMSASCPEITASAPSVTRAGLDGEMPELDTPREDTRMESMTPRDSSPPPFGAEVALPPMSQPELSQPQLQWTPPPMCPPALSQPQLQWTPPVKQDDSDTEHPLSVPTLQLQPWQPPPTPGPAPLQKKASRRRGKKQAATAPIAAHADPTVGAFPAPTPSVAIPVVSNQETTADIIAQILGVQSSASASSASPAVPPTMSP